MNHSAGEYVADKTLHSNTVKNFFSIFKRGVIGTYPHMSEAHTLAATAPSLTSAIPTARSRTVKAPPKPLRGSLASASPTGGLTSSPPKTPGAPRRVGEPRKRYFD